MSPADVISAAPLSKPAGSGLAAAGGQWSLLGGPPARYGASAVWDTVSQRLLVMGGENGARLNDLWSYRLAQDSWVSLQAPGPGPGPLSGQTAVWDGAQLLVYGGYSSPQLHAYRPAENRWVEILPTGPSPPSRGHHSAVWDANDGLMLIFGGIGPSFEFRNDLWGYAPATNTWTQLPVDGTRPFPVFSHSAVWDTLDAQMVVFGGIDPLSGHPLNELWTYQPSSGRWTPVEPIFTWPQARLSQAAVWDAGSGQMLMFGGSCGAGCFLQDIWAYRPADSSWTELPSVGALPPGRAGQSAVWDPTDGLILVVGGKAGPAALGDLWAYRPATYSWRPLARELPSFLTFRHHRAVWDEAGGQMLVYETLQRRLFAYRSQDNTWAELATDGVLPAAREEPSITWDDDRQRLLLFGGYSAEGYLDDLWSYAPAQNTWTQLEPRGPGPPGRFRHAATWADEDRMLVFGGYRDGPLDDLWSYRASLNAWERVSPASGARPGPRADPAAAWDPLDKLLLVYGGLRSDPLDDLWAFSLQSRTWVRAPSRLERPGRRFEAGLVWDPVAGQALLVGGFGNSVAREVWAYQPASDHWTRLAAPGSAAPAPGEHSMVWDTNSGRVLLFSGYRGGVANDLWSFRPAADAWAQPLPSPPKPPARQDAAAAWNDRGREMIVFGGDGGNSALLNDLWAFRPKLGSWLPLPPLPNPPPHPPEGGLILPLRAGGREYLAPEPRRNAAMIWDSSTERLLMFGGLGAHGPLGDLWAYDRRANRWELIDAPGPPARVEASAVWDQNQVRLLVYGGSANGQALDDLWSFDSASLAWSRIAPEGLSPGARYRHAAGWDPDRGRMIVFGGYGGGFPGHYLSDLWAYDPTDNAWHQLSAEGVTPPARARHSLVWDENRQRVLVFGGFAGGIEYLRDLWAYSVAGNAWEPIGGSGGPTPRAGHVAALDSRGALVAFGGGAGAISNELWIYRE